MEIEDLYSREPKQSTPLKLEIEKITPELLREWAIEICKSVESSESMSSREE